MTLDMTLDCILLLVYFVIFYIGSTHSQQLYLGTKTAYYYVGKNASINYPEGCTPVHVDLVSRHGSRYPSNGDRERFDNLLKRLALYYNKTRPFHYKNLSLPWKKWEDWKNALASELSNKGELEQYSIARRLRLRFPNVFEKPYWNKYYQFIARDKRRTSQSAVAFAMGLFEAKGILGRFKFQPVAIKSAGAEEQDKLLSSYDACPRYAIDVGDKGIKQFEEFKIGPEIEHVEMKMKKRFHLARITFDYDMIDSVKGLCAYGIMNHDDSSWCSLLDPRDFDVLNYAEDIKKYYEHSFGNKLSYKIICFLLHDIIESLEKFRRGKSEYRGVFRFASSGTLFSLYTMLGLYDNGTSLRADNYQANDTNRRFSSTSVPMSSNIAFVLYRCNSTTAQEYKIQILINEKVTALPCCHGNTTCTLDHFMEYFKQTSDNCNFDEMCSRSDVHTSKSSYLIGHLHISLFITWIIVVMTRD